VLSDALESIVNVSASRFALFSVTLSARPSDASHPYGHGRVAFFSVGFETALIVTAAVAIFATALPRVFAPQPQSPGPGAVSLLRWSGVGVCCFARVSLWCHGTS
jgi:divalent metal cation (Fe/Co/Zn/Cd) transporter